MTSSSRAAGDKHRGARTFIAANLLPASKARQCGRSRTTARAAITVAGRSSPRFLGPRGFFREKHDVGTVDFRTLGPWEGKGRGEKRSAAAGQLGREDACVRRRWRRCGCGRACGKIGHVTRASAEGNADGHTTPVPLQVRHTHRHAVQRHTRPRTRPPAGPALSRRLLTCPHADRPRWRGRARAQSRAPSPAGWRPRASGR